MHVNCGIVFVILSVIFEWHHLCYGRTYGQRDAMMMEENLLQLLSPLQKSVEAKYDKMRKSHSANDNKGKRKTILSIPVGKKEFESDEFKDDTLKKPSRKDGIKAIEHQRAAFLKYLNRKRRVKTHKKRDYEDEDVVLRFDSETGRWRIDEE